MTHPFNSRRHLTERTLPADRRGPRGSRTSGAGFGRRQLRARPRGDDLLRADRRRARRRRGRRPAAPRLLRLDPVLPPGARGRRLGGPAAGAQPTLASRASGPRWATSSTTRCCARWPSTAPRRNARPAIKERFGDVATRVALTMPQGADADAHCGAAQLPSRKLTTASTGTRPARRSTDSAPHRAARRPSRWAACRRRGAPPSRR